MINVFIVDDSAVVRQTLTEILSSDPDIEVIGTSVNHYLAAEKMRLKAPDVIILDLDLPRMNGMIFLDKIMQQHPIPVIICTNKEEADPDTIMKALARGAVKFIEKTRSGAKVFLEKNRDTIIKTVKSASLSGVRRRQVQTNKVPPKLTADAVLVKAVHRPPAARHGQGSGHRRLHRRHRGFTRGFRSPSRGRTGHSGGPAYAPAFHHGLCQSTEQSLPYIHQGSGP